MGYENAVMDLHKKYDLRNMTVILKPPPKPQNQAPSSSQQQGPPRQPSIAQTQLPSKQQAYLQQKTHQPNGVGKVDKGDKIDNKMEDKKMQVSPLLFSAWKMSFLR